MRSSELTLALASLSLLFAVPVAAKEDHDEDDVSLLSAADLDPAKVLPAPPAANSAQAQAEMAELRAIETARSATDVTAAKHDSATKNASIFAEVLGPSFDLAKLPATREMFEAVRETERTLPTAARPSFAGRDPGSSTTR